eukprot:TRINITY_DN5955_c0_g1_i1.p1 TRINITY_DN5955_c0_g1~~TRINITY_DN5955_c0_g1_i1.p1  ORF type:complete len:209 (-),score=32.04 TRINITY_DN5955_c0_g1_i1:343-885(-)
MAPVESRSSSKQVSEIFLKTRACRYFGLGKCSRGAECTFAHEGELRPRLNLARTKMCPALLEKGACNNVLCDYAHRYEDRKKRRKRLPNRFPVLVETAKCQRSVDKLTSKMKVGADDGASSDSLYEKAAVEDERVRKKYKAAELVHGFRISIRKTFFHVDIVDSSTAAGLKRARSSPVGI